MVQHNSWETIAVDDGLEYKKYTPGSENENWFSGRKYKGKTIMNTIKKNMIFMKW